MPSKINKTVDIKDIRPQKKLSNAIAELLLFYITRSTNLGY